MERKDAKQNETEWKKQRREAESGTEGEAESGGGGERSSLTKQDEHVMKQQRPA